MSVIIRLQKLPLTANASDVRSFFKGLSIPDGGVHIVGGEMGDAFIAFSTDEDARQAMALNGGNINNEPIVLLLSSRAEMQKVIDQARKAALTYMQLSRAASTASSTAAALGLGALAGVRPACELATFSSPPPTVQKKPQQQQLQPPVISFSGGVLGQQPQGSLPVRATASTDSVRTVATAQSAPIIPLVSPTVAYNEIPGLSFLSPMSSKGAIVGATSAVSGGGGGGGGGVPLLGTSSNLSGWLSTFNNPLFNNGATNPGGTADRIDTSFLAHSVTPVNLNGAQNQPQNSWKFLKKERRSRSPSPRERDRWHKRAADGRSRSSSRDRDNKRDRDRRSRSSSRGRSFRRDGRSHSSSRDRDRRSRSWSRSPSREYGSHGKRYRNSRSRSSSRDRFGRSRNRSRSRSSPRNHRSRDSSRDRSPSGGRWENHRDNRQGGSNRGRASNFGGQKQHDPWASSNANPAYGGGGGGGSIGSGMAREVEPIFGLHTAPGGLLKDGRARGSIANGVGGGLNFFSARSGKISPLPSANGLSGGTGLFRNTSPLPDSVYSGVPSHRPSDGTSTSDYSVKLCNLDSATGYGEIRRFFKAQPIATRGIKMINDETGRRTGVAYVKFLREEGKRMALLHDGTVIRRMRIRIESITDQEFDEGIDSYRPSSGIYQSQQQQQHQQQGSGSASGDDLTNNSGGGVAPWNSSSFPRGNDPWDRLGGGAGGNLASGNESTEAANDDHPQETGRYNRAAAGYAPTSALMVWNLPTFTTEQDIMKIFSDFTVVEVLIVKNHSIPKQLDGYVRFHRQEDAKEAWSQVHRHYIGNKKVTVRMCPELDYAVAKNEYENPCDGMQGNHPAEDDEVEFVDGDNNSQDLVSHIQSNEPRPDDGDSADDLANNGHGLNQPDRDQEQQRQLNGTEANERSVAGDSNDEGDRQDRRAEGASARKNRWGEIIEKDWDDEADDDANQSSTMPQEQTMDSDARAGSADRNAPWAERDPRINRGGDGRDNSLPSDSSNYFNNNNNSNNMNNNNNNNDHEGGAGGGSNNNGNEDCNGGGNGMSSRDPRRQQNSSPRRRFDGDGHPPFDNSELFQRTTCLLLRNVDYSMQEEDVYRFFSNDGFRAKKVVLVHERGQRTGECLVEFHTPAEAAHAESKSSQNLGRRKVFVSHLDRGQVADLMKRFDAISKGRRSPPAPRHQQRDGSGHQRSRNDLAEELQGVGCGPYRTSTVGLLNLAYRTTAEDVQNFFREFNLPLEYIHRHFDKTGGPTGEAMVRFRNHMDAEKALNEYQNRKMFGRNVRIRLVSDD